MNIEIIENGKWFHGSNQKFAVLKKGSTITQWQALAEAFSHKPRGLSYEDNGIIKHNGTEYGYLYVIDESIVVGIDIYHTFFFHEGSTPSTDLSKISFS